MLRKVLVIDRSKWRRGETCGHLLNPDDGKMCCLGFDALACGLRKADISGKHKPSEVVSHSRRSHRAYQKTRVIWRDVGADCSEMVWRAMQINDADHLTDAEREAQLIPLLKAIGGYTDVQFIN